MSSNNQQGFDDSVSSIESEVSLESVTTAFNAVYIDEAELRPNGVFKKGYREISTYEATSFGAVTLKKTKNGQRAKSGIELERSISSKRH